MTNEEYFFYEKKIQNLLNITRNHLSPEGLEEVEHYLGHAEIEMAFELLCLELIEANVAISQEVGEELTNIAQHFNLAENFVYEARIVEKLNEYLSKFVT